MYVERIPNRNSPPAILLRESYRDGDKIRKRTLANLSDWPGAKIEALRRVLRGDAVAPVGREALSMQRSLPHGHVAAALGTLRKLGLDRLLLQGGRQPKQEVALCVAMIVARLIEPASKLATARLLDGETATCSLGQVLGLGAVDEQQLYGALDWLVEQQERIEKALARRHLKNGTLVLYDVSSTYFEGRTCELAQFGHNRDGKHGKLQIVFGLLCSQDGCPVAIEVFEGNVGDPSTLPTQIAKLKERFNLDRVVLVGDRGMITEARIRESVKPADLDFITALRAPAIRKLVDAGELQPSLFDARDLAEIVSLDYPGERLVVCRCSPRSGGANAANCWPPPRRNCAKSRPACVAPRDRCAVAMPSALPSARSSITTRWPSTSTSPSPTTISSSSTGASRSTTRPCSMVSTSCAPTSRPNCSIAPRSSAPTKACRMSSVRSAVSKPSISRSGRSITVAVAACAPTCCCACSPTISNGTCARRSSRSCSTITTSPRPTPPVAPSSPRQSAPKPPSVRSMPGAPMTICRCTASNP